MALCAAAANDLGGLGRTRQHSGHPLAVLYDRVGSVANGLIGTQHVQRLGPQPLRRVDTTLVGRIVDLPAAAERVDLISLLDSGVVFPQHEHCVGVLGELLLQSQRRTLLVDEAGGRARRVECQTHYVGSHLGAYLREHLAYSSLQHLDIILRVLTILVGGGVAIFALLPTGIVAYGRSQRLTVCRIDQYGTSRVATVVQTNYIFLHSR